MDAEHHVSVNVEQALVVRMHHEAAYAREQASVADAAWRHRLQDLATTDDPGEQARIRQHALRLRAQAELFERRAELTGTRVRGAIRAAASIDDDADPAALEPVTYRKVTKAERDQQTKERVELAWADLRSDRDRLLAASDWTQGRDVPATVDVAAWERYRQRLRDLPEKVNDPLAVKWPVPPS